MYSTITRRLYIMNHFIDIIRLQYRRLRIGASLHRNDALGALHRAWGYVHATQMMGDYYEFGVYRGASLISSRLSQQHFRRHLEHSRDLPFLRQGSVARFLQHNPTFYGFDTFAGMPENAEGEDSLAPGSFKADLAPVLRRCRLMGLRPPTLQLFPGLFSQTSHNIGPHPAAIVHIDCDLYASAADALGVIAPRLTQGTILLFDDYNLFRADNRQGERRALAEFLATHDITVEPWFAYGPASQAFICHRAAP